MSLISPLMPVPQLNYTLEHIFLITTLVTVFTVRVGEDNINVTTTIIMIIIIVL